MEHIKSPNEGLYTSDREHGHEESDINIRAILGFGLALFLAAVLIHVGLWGMYKRLDAMAERNAPPPPTAVRGGRPEIPSIRTETEQQTLDRLKAEFPGPRLQPDEVRDFKDFRAQEDEQLNNYAWTNQFAGKLRIPISKAMELVAARGLPTVEQPAPPAGGGQGPAENK